MPDSTIQSIGANLDKFGTDYQGYIDQLKALYATDTTTPQLEAFAANQAKQKTKDIGTIQGLQESYGLSGSGQEIKSLEDLMTGYADQYKDYALKLTDINKQNQIAGVTQLAGMSQTAYQNAQQAQQTQYNMKQDDLTIYMNLYQDYINSGKETPESAQAKATADFYRLTGRNYGGSTGTGTGTDTPGSSASTVPEWLLNMPSDFTGKNAELLGSYTPEQIGQKILYDKGYANPTSITGNELLAKINEEYGTSIFDSQQDIIDFVSGKVNIGLTSKVDSGEINAKLNTLDQDVENATADLTTAGTSLADALSYGRAWGVQDSVLKDIDKIISAYEGGSWYNDGWNDYWADETGTPIARIRKSDAKRLYDAAKAQKNAELKLTGVTNKRTKLANFVGANGISGVWLTEEELGDLLA